MWVNNQIRVLYVVVVIDIEPIRERFSAVAPFLDERGSPSGRGGRGVRRGLWRDRGGRDGDRGCTEHDRARSEGIGAGRAVQADPATGSWAQENDLQGPEAAPRSRSAGRADDTR